MRNYQNNLVLGDAAMALAEQYCRPGMLPHLQLLVSVDGKIELNCCFGTARDEESLPLESDAIFRIASMTKPVAVAAFMTLVEQGVAGLDMKLADIMPEYAALKCWTGATEADGVFATQACEAPVTLYDLLRHMAGFSYGIHGATLLDSRYNDLYLDSFHPRVDVGGYARAAASLPLRYQPGTRFHYSIAIDVLGGVIERLSGTPLDRFLAERIFEPLGMADTGFVIPPEKEGRLPDAWFKERKNAEPVLYDRGAQSRWRQKPASFSAGGGLLSTAEDYHRFLLMMMHGGALDGRRILLPENVGLMMRNHLPGGGDLLDEECCSLSETSLPGIGMGLGAAVIVDPERAQAPGSAGTWFWGGILSTGFFLDPVRRVIAIVMTQIMPSGMTALREDVRRHVYAALGDT